jgi:hypothetical protein
MPPRVSRKVWYQLPLNAKQYPHYLLMSLHKRMSKKNKCHVLRLPSSVSLHLLCPVSVDYFRVSDIIYGPGFQLLLKGPLLKGSYDCVLGGWGGGCCAGGAT